MFTPKIALALGLAAYSGAALFHARCVYRQGEMILCNAPKSIQKTWRKHNLFISFYYGILWPMETLPLWLNEPGKYMEMCALRGELDYTDENGIKHQWRRYYPVCHGRFSAIGGWIPTNKDD